MNVENIVAIEEHESHWQNVQNQEITFGGN